MTTLAAPETPASDAELILRVRDGDVGAYGALFSRHVDAANRLARAIAGRAKSDDLVSEAFVKVLNELRDGGGPDIAFRAYLLSAVRGLHLDRQRTQRGYLPVADLAETGRALSAADVAAEDSECSAAARAFASLPERWQQVLWHLEVENQKPATIGPMLGTTPRAVSALATRAREGLREAFLFAHRDDMVDQSCRECRDRLDGYVRGGLSREDHETVDAHLERCRPCTAVYLELHDANASLAALLGPAVLGSSAQAYLSLPAAPQQVGSLGRRTREALGSGRQMAAAMVVAAGLIGTAAVAGIAITERSGPDSAQAEDFVTADPDSAATSGTDNGQPSAAATPPSAKAPPSDDLSSQSTYGMDDTPAGVGQQRSNAAASGGRTPKSAPGSAEASRSPRPDSSPSATAGSPGQANPRGQKRARLPAVDLTVSVDEAEDDLPLGQTRYTGKVGGMPHGGRATLAISAINGARVVPGDSLNCEPAPDVGSAIYCTVNQADRAFTFTVSNLVGTEVSMLLAEPVGYHDTDLGNNTYSVQVDAPADPETVKDDDGRAGLEFRGGAPKVDSQDDATKEPSGSAAVPAA